MTTPDPIDTFRQEARELLESLEQSLLDLDQNPSDSELVDSAFRALHTLKGSGAMFGFDEVAEFVHDFETAFDQVRKGNTDIETGLVTVALSAKDHVSRLIAEPGQHAEAGKPILKALHWIVATNRDAVSDTPSSDSLDSNADDQKNTQHAIQWRVRFHLPVDALVVGANPVLLLDELRDLGPCEVATLTDTVPALEDIEPENAYLGWEVLLETSSERQAIEDVFLFVRDEMDLVIEPVSSLAEQEMETALQSELEKPTTTAANTSGTASSKSASSLRVPAERLDELMDRVGELVIAQARLSQIAADSQDLNLKAVAEEIERLSSGLRDTTMGIRMVPIGTLFGRFRRLVRDLSGELGKTVNFITSGEETELDKTMIERLADPLVHIIRNAVDHGLEIPDKRVATGKPTKGSVSLSAIHTGAEVAISISDDGAGLDSERIRAKAVEQSLIAPDANLSDQELFPLIFHPGFSTAGQITNLSGRGVGMDVVKQTIDALRGAIDVNSTAGEGTTVTLRLPLTLAIIDGMLVRVGQGRYSIPLSAVEECVELTASEAEAAKGRNFLNIRDTLVPFLRLRELFGTKAPADMHQKVVIVSAGENRVGLVVDQIIGNNQTVIKSLSKLHTEVETFSGATILGDGTVALILDVNHLVRFGQSFEERLRNGRAA